MNYSSKRTLPLGHIKNSSKFTFYLKYNATSIFSKTPQISSAKKALEKFNVRATVLVMMGKFPYDCVSALTSVTLFLSRPLKSAFTYCGVSGALILGSREVSGKKNLSYHPNYHHHHNQLNLIL